MVYDGEERQAVYCYGIAAGTACDGSYANKTVYHYDAEGRRVRREGVGGEAVFVYDGMGELALELAANSTGAGIGYLTADQLGSTRVVTGADGAARECFDYLPFGQELNWPCGQSGGTRVRFTGKERDAETGLDYFGARYMSAAQGRFTSPDPFSILQEAKDREELDEYLADPQNWNRYAYVGNNPLKFIDPDGRNKLLMWLANPANQRMIEGYARRGAEAANRYGTAAYNWGTRLFNSAAGQEITQTAIEIATDSQAPQSTRIGAAREVAVAALTGGRLASVAGEGLKVTVKGLGSTDIDVIGKAGEFIAVGGPAKARKPAELGHHLKVLKAAAEQAGVKAQAYFATGTPESVLKVARKRLGEENVFEFE
ncbi:MAG: RHS repeat-associated core domain-containing protein [Bryobacterales bacterium]|nr:RHS repeat-associated core domain-containing protein [Bryobacterales bacterium]